MAPVEIPQPPINAELLRYCEKPYVINPDDALSEALTKLVENHGIYAKCYLSKRDLVDAINRRKAND